MKLQDVIATSVILLSLHAFAEDQTARTQEITEVPATNSAPTTKFFDPESFAKKMGVQPLGNDFPSFFGFMGDPQSQKYSMGLAIVTYKCHGGNEITLIPMVHTAEPSYLKYTDDLAKKSDLLLYESVRPATFSGPPFNKDPNVKTRDDYEKLTMQRLQTMAQKFQDFRSEQKRDLTSMAEFFTWKGMEPQFAKSLAAKLLVDSWGHPLQFKVGPNGHPLITSLGADGVESADDLKVSSDGPTLPLDPGQAKAMEMMAAQRKLVSATGLSWQISYPFQSYLTAKAVNADISADMLSKDLPLETRLANTHLRNVMPILKIEELKEEGKLPKTVSIMYGTDHLLKFHQYLTGKELACKPQKVDWQMAINGDSDLKKNGTTDEQLAIRRATIEQISKKPPVLDVDVSGVGDALRAQQQVRAPSQVPTFGKPLF
jgi:hypothetical protein